jgi:drug/metabolite transporter (DMT)-like permease
VGLASPTSSSPANIVCFGLSWPIIKIGLEAASPIWFAAARATLSAVTAFVLLACLRRLAWPPRADWPIVLSVGALQLACFFAFSNLGLQSLPAGRSSVLAYTASLWVVPLSLLIGEKVGWRARPASAGRGGHRGPRRSAALRLD